jgi:ATP dependent DNA ligase domain
MVLSAPVEYQCYDVGDVGAIRLVGGRASSWSNAAAPYCREFECFPTSDRFPEVIAELLTLIDVVLDAEFVVLDEHGHRVFERLIRRLRLKKRISIEHGSRSDPAVLFAFDVLELKGKDVRSSPLLDRKVLLKKTLAGSKRIRYIDHVDDGQWLFKAAESMRLEGIVAKRTRPIVGAIWGLDQDQNRSRSGDR